MFENSRFTFPTNFLLKSGSFPLKNIFVVSVVMILLLYQANIYILFYLWNVQETFLSENPFKLVSNLRETLADVLCQLLLLQTPLNENQ